ncbi:MAG: PAS domain S-box protein [Thermodesulfobacteriota bacterium]|nr:PAS domain S-box protein [Thermodesulfobacteriota bacterium]
MIRWIRKSLTIKWMVFSILLAILPLAIAGYQIIQIYQGDLKKSIIEIEKMKANMVVEKTEAFFENVLLGLFLLTMNEGFIKGGPSYQKEHLENLLYQNNHLLELTLLDRKGRETIKVSKYKFEGSLGLEDRSKSELFEVVLSGGVYWGEFSLDKDVVPSMIIAVPVKESNGELKNVLSGRITFPYLWNLIPKPLTDKKGVTYVVDDHGTLIAHTDINSALSRLNVKHLPMVKKVLDGKEGNLEFVDSRGEKFLAIYRPIHKWGWGVIIQVPVVEAYKPLQQVARTAFQWILITLGFAIIISLILTRRLTVPIRRLSGEMARVSQGNLDVHIKTTQKDEVGFLTGSFNQMIHDLKHSHEAIKEAEEKYRRIFEESKDMVYITSVEGKIIDVNQAGVDLFGYASKEEMMQVYVRDTFFNPEDRKKFRNEIRKEWFVKDFEVKLKRKDGTLINILITANARRDDSGKIISYEGTIKDISNRKIMEEELLRRAEELQTLHELSNLINRSLDLNAVLSLALDKMLKLTGFEMGGTYLLREDGETFEDRFLKGYSPEFIENLKIQGIGGGITGEAVRLKQTVILSIDKYPFSQRLPFFKKEGIQSIVSIPLLGKEKAVGAITLTSRFHRTLNQRDIHLLESIGSQIGLAIENAKLFSFVEKAKSEWEATFDSVTDLISIKDKDYRILRANKAVFERYGMKPEEVIGKRCYEVLYHREGPCEKCAVSDTFLTGRPALVERGSKLFKGMAQFSTFPILDENGEVVAVVESIRDVTEQKRIEKEKEVISNINKILASSLDVRQVFKAVHSELKKALDSERMTITLLNEERGDLRHFALEKDYDSQELMEGVTYTLKGTPSEKAMKTGLPVIVSDTEKQNDSWISEKLLEEGIHSILVFPLEYKGKIFGTMNFGSKPTHHFLPTQLSLLQQIAPGLAISIQNALLLDEIKKSEEKYRTVVEGALDGIAVVGTDFKFKYTNNRLAEILGYTKEELEEMDFRNILAEESRQFVVDRYVKWVRKEENSPHFEFNALRKDGEVRNIEMSNKEMRDSEGTLNFIAIMRDITEKKKMEEQLFQSEKLRSLGEMASGVAHDFNNALAAILGNAQLMLITAQDEEAKESLRTIEKVARDAAQTVKRLQEFTRKRTRQELFKIDINSIVKDAAEITKPRWKDDAQGRGIQIEMVLNLGEVSPIGGNASEMREVITNMIFNAIEAMPEGGKVDVRTFQKGGEVYIQIADTGAGMTEEVRKKIFEPFFTTKPFTNTGLGLSMSYGIIKRFRGEIEVESKVGNGTTFTIVLPINLGSGEEAIPDSTIKKGKSARILVIEDEETVRDVLAQMLSKVNHQVTVAKNGEEGIRLFNELEFDMVLTDLGMPGMSGWEVCQKIKKMNPYTPVGMITGWGIEVSQSKMEECGLDFLLSKPFDFNQVLKVVSETMESGTTFSS